MKDIRIFCIRKPEKGSYIPEGDYVCTKTEDGLPAMHATWQTPKMLGAFLATEHRLFVFRRDAALFSFIDDKISQEVARGVRPNPLRYTGGILVHLIGLGIDLARISLNDTSGTKGITFAYRNEAGEGAFCWGIARAEIAQDILSSIPPERNEPIINLKVT